MGRTLEATAAPNAETAPLRAPACAARFRCSVSVRAAVRSWLRSWGVTDLTPELLLHAYRVGYFPMADPTEPGEPVYWYAPDPRAVLPLDAFHVPRSLRRVLRRAPFRVTADRAFERVMRACAEPGPGREDTWISDELVGAYVALHARGHAHSVECWADREGAEPELVGGLYGVSLGGAFFGESMFSRRADASKVALVHLVERLRAGGYALLDIQMTTPHLERFGAVEIAREAYERRLAHALGVRAAWGGAAKAE